MKDLKKDYFGVLVFVFHAVIDGGWLVVRILITGLFSNKYLCILKKISDYDDSKTLCFEK